jgi:hypothetical protein
VFANPTSIAQYGINIYARLCFIKNKRGAFKMVDAVATAVTAIRNFKMNIRLLVCFFISSVD